MIFTPPQTHWHLARQNSLISRLLNASASMTETDFAMGIIPLITALGTLAQGKFSVGIPWKSGVHFEPLCIFGLTIAHPSERKSSVNEQFYLPINKIVEESLADYVCQKRQVQCTNENAKAKLKQLRRRLTRVPDYEVAGLEAAIAKVESEIREVPHPLKLVVTDVRGTALAREINCQPGARLTISDAEDGCLDPLLQDRSLRKLLSDAFNGGSAEYLRSSAPGIVLPKAHVTYNGMFQPSKLVRMAAKTNLWDEGFVPRMLMVFPQSMAGSRFGNPIGDQEIWTWYEQKMRYLRAYLWRTPERGGYSTHEILMDDAAAALWKQCSDQIERLQAPTQPSYAHRAWYGKMPGVIARVAALFHLLETNVDPVQTKVCVAHMDMAINLIQDMIPHMQIVHEILCPNEALDAAFHIARWLMGKGMVQWFSVAEVISNTKLHAQEAHLGARYLQQLGAIIPRMMDNIPGRKPRSQEFVPNYPLLQNIVSSFSFKNA